MNIGLAFQIAITAALKSLLGDKALYQRIDIKKGVAENSNEEMAKEYAHLFWIPKAASVIYGPGLSLEDIGGKQFAFEPPTIRTGCEACQSVEPFNVQGVFVQNSETRGSPDCRIPEQWFTLSYQCQNCKGVAVRYLVRRSGWKLILAGRDPLLTVAVPNVIPPKHRDRYGDVIVARNAGQILAAICLMRIFIEQYWKAQDAVAEAVEGKPRPTGEELGEAYKSMLPDDFKTRFGTLTKLYEPLSEAMHSAEAKAELLDDAIAATVSHFEALRIFKIEVK
jgi:hypothetical protein